MLYHLRRFSLGTLLAQMFFVLSIFLLVVFFTMMTAQAQEQEQEINPFLISENPEDDFAVEAGEATVIATVEMYGAELTEIGDGRYAITFDFYNDVGVQPQVRYAVDLIRQSESGQSQELIDRHVYDEVLSLAEQQRLSKEIIYDVPKGLTGTYQVWLVSMNSQSLPFAKVRAGEITLNDTSAGVTIVPRSCALQIEGEEGFYNVLEGPDISVTERLVLRCTIVNTSSDTISVRPAFQNYHRSSFGDPVGTAIMGEVITIEGNVESEVSFQLPTIQKAQSYDIGVTLTDAQSGQELSNTVYAHYVVQGKSATIQTVVFDKDYYAEGDTAKVSFTWTGPADIFPNSRGTGTTFEGVVATVRLLDGNGAKCAESVTREMDFLENVVAIDIPVAKPCRDPHLEASLVDDTGELLTTGSFAVHTVNEPEEGVDDTEQIQPEEKQIDIFTILTISNVLLWIIVLIILIKVILRERRTGVTGPLILLLIAGVGFLLPSGVPAHAVTFIVGGNGGEAIYNASLENDLVEPGGELTVYGDGTGGWCGNGYRLLRLTSSVNNQTKRIFNQNGFAADSYHCTVVNPTSHLCKTFLTDDSTVYYGERSFTVQSNPGTYDAHIRGLGFTSYTHGLLFGGTTERVTIPYTVQAEPPDVDITLNGSDGPVTVDLGEEPQLSWSSNTHVTACRSEALSAPAPSDWSNTSRPLSSNLTLDQKNVVGTYVYRIVCENSVGVENVDSVTLYVQDPATPQPPPPSNSDPLIFAVPEIIDSGATTTLNWDTDGGTNCEITSSNNDANFGGVSGLPVVSTGAGDTVPLFGETTYTITCDGGGTDTDTVKVRVREFIQKF